MSQPYWQQVGPDFHERMMQSHPVQETKVVAVDFRSKATTSDAAKDMPAAENQSWRAACQRMRDLHPEHYRNWISLLTFGHDDHETVVLNARNQFVAHYVQTHLIPVVHEAVEATLGPRRRIVVQVVQ